MYFSPLASPLRTAIVTTDDEVFKNVGTTKKKKAPSNKKT